MRLRLFSLSLLWYLRVPIAAALSPGSTRSDPPIPNIVWHECPPQTPEGIDCGSINVPLGYSPANSIDPVDNRTISLELTRLNSTGNALEKDVMFFNPGGPGISAAYFVIASTLDPSLAFSPSLREAYDIIGLDPRGVGWSTPVQCDPDIYNERVSTFVNDATGYNALVNYGRRLSESCAELTGPMINHLDTVHVAKDHELVRRALQAPKLNYLGLSYGAQLGPQYVSLFPEAVGRMALDALVDHGQSETSTLLAEAVTYEASLNQFFTWCDRNSSCALYGRNTMQVFDALVAQADATPIPAPGCDDACRSDVTGEEIRYNVQSYLRFIDLPLGRNWINLGTALAESSQGNATMLSSELATETFSTRPDQSPFLYIALGCVDWLHQARSAIDLQQKLQMVRTFAPRSAGASWTYTYQSRCLGWSAPVTNGQTVLDKGVSKAPPILLVNSIYDPECSMAWAQGLREQLPSGVSVTRNGHGHTSYFLQGETSEAINKFLSTGEMAEDGTIFQT
ncbi:unnamed protein product [Clonostachys solani]|uniref:Uncharacterized protein n=1 Tax=Clonostachys solani TaxID=160281 RepID=A0A9N9ZLZ1_9HYPO|nr:unnamed protein product [Clonostachys solani]